MLSVCHSLPSHFLPEATRSSCPKETPSSSHSPSYCPKHRFDPAEEPSSIWVPPHLSISGFRTCYYPSPLKLVICEGMQSDLTQVDLQSLFLRWINRTPGPYRVANGKPIANTAGQVPILKTVMSPPA
ncbi:hypothetical protein JTB14_009998 [Gonioctena quinquepunctata]|nr:hypothetical protein JTB14_009998 [Gonioctena quinquepunctata]